MANLINESNLPSTQHAVLIKEFGAPEVMSYQAGVALPSIDKEQVLIKVAYAGINPVEYKTRQGKGWGADVIQKNNFAKNKPAILGFDVAGVVVKSNSSKFKPGDQVAALSFEGGSYAEYVSIDAKLLAKVPASLTLEQAGALPCVGQTALQFVEFAAIKKGEHVVMNAPAGGVGQLVVQLLLDKVAKDNIKLTVICSPDKYKKLDSFIDKDKLAGWIDYTKDKDFPDLQAYMLLDLVGDDAGVRALSVLKKNANVKVLPSIWVDKLKEAGSDKNLKVDGFAVTPKGESMAEVLKQVADGKLKLHIQKTYPLSEVIQAHTQLQKGDTFGKIVLKVAEDTTTSHSTDKKGSATKAAPTKTTPKAATADKKSNADTNQKSTTKTTKSKTTNSTADKKTEDKSTTTKTASVKSSPAKSTDTIDTKSSKAKTDTTKSANTNRTTDKKASTDSKKPNDDKTYEAQARQEIEAWKNPDPSVFNKTFAAVSAPIDKAGDMLMNLPQFGGTLKQATERTIVTMSDMANWTLDVQDVIESYRNEANTDGVEVKSLKDIETLPIEVIDQQVERFKSKYVALTSAQGLATGMAGWAGIPADIVGLIATNLRAIGEYATYYGFDMSDKNEQLFAMSLLAVATSNSADERQAALEDSFSMVKDPETLAFNKVNEEVMSRVLRQTATKVATNMVKTKAAQVIPALGAMVAGGVNANFTASVCEATYQSYRERFLNRQEAR